MIRRIPVKIFPEILDVGFSVRSVIDEVRVFVDIEHDERDTAPDASLVVRVTAVDLQPSNMRVPGKHNPSTHRHTCRRKERDKFLERTVFFYDGVYECPRCFSCSTQTIKVIFV